MIATDDLGGTGRVVGFDEAVGLGQVEADDGRILTFHCTEIADGSRRIDVGARVRFVVGAARCGKWEAAEVEAAPS